MPETLVSDIRAIEGVSNVDSIRQITGSVHSASADGGRWA